MNWSRENSQSTERASAFASVVFPTPGKSSMIRWPSASRESTVNSSVSGGAWTTAARLPTIRRIASAGALRSTALTGSSISLQHRCDLVHDLGCDSLLRRLLDSPLRGGRNQHDLVVRGVEADVVS